MRSGTKPGHHAGHKAAGLGTALAHDARGAFSGVWGCFPGLHTGSDGGKVRPRYGPEHSRAIIPGKKQPGLGQHWHTAQGEAFSGDWGCFP